MTLIRRNEERRIIDEEINVDNGILHILCRRQHATVISIINLDYNFIDIHVLNLFYLT